MKSGLKKLETTRIFFPTPEIPCLANLIMTTMHVSFKLCRHSGASDEDWQKISSYRVLFYSIGVEVSGMCWLSSGWLCEES